MVYCVYRNFMVFDIYIGDMLIVDMFIYEIDVLCWLLNDDYVFV